MNQRFSLMLTKITPGNERFLYNGEVWGWKKTSSGLHVVGTDRKGLWGNFTNGKELVRIYKGDLIEVLGEEAANLIFQRNPYPPKCFVYITSADEIGVVTRGELGYRPAQTQIVGLDKRQTVDRLNEALGVSKAHAAAMNAGSIFGWDCPAARPSAYDKNGKPRLESHVCEIR